MKATRLADSMWVLVAASAVLAMGLMCGCLSTFQARTAVPSGFLGDYSQLKKGTNGQPLLVYVDPRADFTKYGKIMMDPVRMYAAKPDSDLARVSKEDQQRLVNYFDAALRQRLKADYALVAQTGPDVMRLRVAITEAKGAKVLLDTASTVTPIGLAISGLKTIATGSGTSVGSIGAEFEVLDSTTQERLAAAVDERIGRKITGKFDKFNKWRTAEDSFDYWAERVQTRLREASGKAVSR